MRSKQFRIPEFSHIEGVDIVETTSNKSGSLSASTNEQKVPNQMYSINSFSNTSISILRTEFYNLMAWVEVVIHHGWQSLCHGPS